MSERKRPRIKKDSTMERLKTEHPYLFIRTGNPEEDARRSRELNQRIREGSVDTGDQSRLPIAQLDPDGSTHTTDGSLQRKDEIRQRYPRRN